MSLRLLIEAKCRDCTYHPTNGGTWREQIEACSVQACPLWTVRPVTLATKKARMAEKTPAQLLANQKAGQRLAESRRNSQIS